MTRLARTTTLALGILAFGCSDDDADDGELMRAALSGANEVPARSTSASGNAAFTVSGETVTFSLEVADLSAITMAHIHSGTPGVNGPIRVFLFRGPQTTVGERRLLSQGTFTAADVTGIGFAELLQEMRSGAAYVNVHTVQFPGGEIRGPVQIVD